MTWGGWSPGCWRRSSPPPSCRRISPRRWRCAAREAESQRTFAARIIDSLPVGLYVIDRDYVIRAWNRKRESGTQGVARDDAVGREIFDVLDRQPRDLLQREFDRVFETGEIQQMEMESHASGDARYYRITKIPMRLDDVRHHPRHHHRRRRHRVAATPSSGWRRPRSWRRSASWPPA